MSGPWLVKLGTEMRLNPSPGTRAILPLPRPIKLPPSAMWFRQKIVLVATFIAGGFVAILDVSRIVYLQAAIKEKRQTFGPRHIDNKACQFLPYVVDRRGVGRVATE
ncbi:hypothetical protein EHS25_000950 [Saitozyma podzolica]|uniref:Uncharacterized protein n=1 Tax=Saitozyma podzolica TaxID=1890683 RepID=A0A427YXP4_9TREE|nr:hypothetical protein EHS25_000950 [Saitozyma podzolica]